MVVLGDIRRSLASRKSYDVRDEEGGPASVGFLLYNYSIYSMGMLMQPLDNASDRMCQKHRGNGL